ncbi:hypothetical protein B0H19DRAFT_1234248 [Mycena capillaripes]|nr:hypothetical protein B0H19DRAFT_1234248 [Mycena capillaripes]
MPSDYSEHSVPFLEHPSSSSELGDMNEKPFDPRLFLETPTIDLRERRGRKSRLQPFLSKLLGWPAIVMGGQMVLQMGAWGFFAAVEKRGFFALPYSTAAWVKANAHPVTVIFTLISTVLAACSSFLFSWGVRQSIALHLHGEGMSMGTFISTLRLSSRSLILDPRKWKWSAMSIALVILTGVQTSGFVLHYGGLIVSCLTLPQLVRLLTPLQIEIKTPLTGYELDLSSPLLQQMQSGGALDYCVVNSSGTYYVLKSVLITYFTANLPAFLVGQTESGYAAMKSDMDFPGSLTLMDQSYNLSTAGILPMMQLDVNATSFFPNQNVTTIPANLTSAFDIGDDFLSSHYSMMQQGRQRIMHAEGFTANVTCEFQNLTANSTPSLNILSDTVKDWASGSQSFAVTHTEMSSNCVVPDGSERIGAVTVKYGVRRGLHRHSGDCRWLIASPWSYKFCWTKARTKMRRAMSYCAASMLLVLHNTFTPLSGGSAVAVERFFSGGRDTISLSCACLKPETIRTLMLIKHHLRMKRKSLEDALRIAEAA